MAVFGAIMLTLIVIGALYAIIGYTMVVFGFSDLGASARITWLIIVAGLIGSICMFWYLFVGTHIHLDFS